ncbi:MAG: aldehyde dehydrogenase family protein, partial [Anaerolineaceae bacterium]
MKTYQMLINGEWVDSESGETFDDMNPYNGEVYARVQKGNEKDADKAMAAAYAARKPWSSTSSFDRALIIAKAGHILEESRMEFAEVLTGEGGGTFGKTMFEISQTVDLLATAAADG